MGLEEGFDNILVIDGIPIVDKGKLEKLLAKISKEFNRKGAVVRPDSMTVPWNDATGKSQGYVNSIFKSPSACQPPFPRFIFIEFRTADEATFALNEMNGHPFDKTHTFRVNRFSDIEKYANLNETYLEPKREEYQSKVCNSPHSLQHILTLV